MSATRIASRTVLLLGLASLGACNTLDRLENVGQAPALTPIVNPTTQANYQPVAMPMPTPQPEVRQANSLWRQGARTFFRDQRAARVGDILTVNIDIADEAQIDNTTTRTRDNSEGANLNKFFGLETIVGRALPGNPLPGVVDVGSTTSNTGTGTVDRKEAVKLTVAAVVNQVLPNGNMVIQGSQEVRVNFEVRELQIAGVVRPEDISSANTIQHTQIAEARISYGGRGQITDVQQPRYGQQVYDIIMPF
ncbi:flagellar basal body L-ring protein FlgH [Zavarzinia sp. CC-PAN008]|uniref:flagellar basal body L-ring protein FlgH n=1 Tax=Zavarzinia sp. CC-PAN008 TaxID=3243332 RepID=UPI003F7480B1